MSNIKKFIKIKRKFAVYNKHTDTYEIELVVNLPKHEWIAEVTCKGYDPQTFKISQLNLKWFVMDKSTKHQLHVKYNKMIFKEVQTEVLLELFNLTNQSFGMYGDS